MFKKIVSQLSFSPALVGQLSFYAKRLRKEQATRRLGLVFVALALVVQSLVVFQGPDPANAANPGDMIYGGLGLGSARSLNNFLNPYDRNDRNLQDIMNYYGITRAEIAATTFGKYTVGDKIVWGYEPRPGVVDVAITNGSGQVVNHLYGRPQNIANGRNTEIWAYIGYSSKIGWFAIQQYCGNLITDVYPTPPPPPAPTPTPAKVVYSKSAVNASQNNVDASKTTAKASDKITYTLTAKNTGGTATSIVLSDHLSDVLTYSRLINQGGGTFNSTAKTLSWPATDLAPGATVTKSFTIQMNSSLVTTKTNCTIVNNFSGDTVTIPVGCTPPPAKIEPSKSAYNDTQKKDATKTTAKANDKITYTVTVKNTGGTAKAFTPSDDLSDVLTFAKLTNNGGGTLNNTSKVISWPTVTLKPNETVTKKFTVQIQSNLVTRQSDCKLVNNFHGESVTVPVGCTPPPAELEVSKSAININQGNIDATKKPVVEKDRITFKLVAKNNGGTAMNFTFVDNIGDTLEYAKLTDNGGGTYDQATRKLSWPAINLKPGETQVRTFTVQVLDTIPATPQGVSDPSSYNCKIENVFYDASVIIPVHCVTPPKVIENVVTQLPTTGPRENMLFAGIVLAIVAFFYFRSRQLGTEVRLIRREVNGGTF